MATTSIEHLTSMETLIQRIEAYFKREETMGIFRTEAPYLLREALAALKEGPITRIGESAGRAFVVYLSDGTKVIVGRDRTTKGPAWLEVQPQAKIVPMGECTSIERD